MRKDEKVLLIGSIAFLGSFFYLIFKAKKVGAEPVQPPECNEGETKCEGYDLYQCQNGRWVLKEQNSTQCGYVPPTKRVIFRTNAKSINDYYSQDTWIAVDLGNGLVEFTTPFVCGDCDCACGNYGCEPKQFPNNFIVRDPYGVEWYRAWCHREDGSAGNPYQIVGYLNGENKSFICFNQAGGPSCYGAEKPCPSKGAELSPYPTEPYASNGQEVYA